MKKIFCCATLCALFVLQRPTASIACGDKFLVKTGIASKVVVCCWAAKPAAILIYRDPNNKAAENALGEDMQRMLTNAGHTVRVVDNQKDFESAIKNEVFDVVVSAFSAAAAAEKTLHDAGKTARIVPVVDKENETEINSAKERYGHIIKDDDRTSSKVLVVTEVLLDQDRSKKA